MRPINVTAKTKQCTSDWISGPPKHSGYTWTSISDSVTEINVSFPIKMKCILQVDFCNSCNSAEVTDAELAFKKTWYYSESCFRPKGKCLDHWKNRSLSHSFFRIKSESECIWRVRHNRTFWKMNIVGQSLILMFTRGVTVHRSHSSEQVRYDGKKRLCN